MRINRSLFFVLIIGFCLRLFFLLINPSIGGGEERFWTYAHLSLPALLGGNYPDFDAHPFFYYLLLKVWMLISTDETWVRFLSLITSVGTIIMVYEISRMIFGRKQIAFLAALLFACSAYSVHYATLIEPYSLLLFLVSIHFFLFLQCLTIFRKSTGRLKVFVLLMISTFLSTVTGYGFFWWIIAENAVVMIFFAGSVVSEKPKYVRRLLILCVFLNAGLFFFLPWLPKAVFLIQTALSERSYISVPDIKTFFAMPLVYLTYGSVFGASDISVSSRLWQMFSAVQNALSVIAKTGGVILLGFYYWTSISLTLRNRLRIFSIVPVLLVFTGLFFPFIVSQRFPLFVHHHLMLVQIAIIPVLAWGIWHSGRKAVLIFPIFLIVNVIGFILLLNYAQLEDWRSLYHYVTDKEYGNESLFLFHLGISSRPFVYYSMKEKTPLRYSIVTFDEPETEADRDLSLIVSHDGFKRICLVTSYQRRRGPEMALARHTDIIEERYVFEGERVFPPLLILQCYVEKS